MVEDSNWRITTTGMMIWSFDTIEISAETNKVAGYLPRKDGELIAMSFISVEDLERGKYDEIYTNHCILKSLARDDIGVS